MQGPWGGEVWSQGEELCAVALQEVVFKYLSSLTANKTVLFAISCLYLIPRRLSLVCELACDHSYSWVPVHCHLKVTACVRIIRHKLLDRMEPNGVIVGGRGGVTWKKRAQEESLSCQSLIEADISRKP